MNYLPDIDLDFSQDENATRQMLDYAINQWQLKRTYRQWMEKLYNHYNGLVSDKETQSTTKSTGKESKTKYVKYRIGRSKMKQLHGEFLEINLEPTVSTVNREAQNKKMEKYKSMLGMSLAKSQINKVREIGYPVYNGIDIPDFHDKEYWSMNNFKLANEIAMQNIIDDKIQNENLKMEFYQNYVDVTITSECFGKVERNSDGRDVYRIISPRNALYEESYGDPFIKKTPYMGERREMYYHEIITNPEFELNETQKKRIKENYNTNSLGEDGYSDIRKSQDYRYTAVYTLEWIGIETVYLITSEAKNSDVPFKKVLDEKEYQKKEKQIKKDVDRGRIKLEKFYRQILWSASKIGHDTYTKAKKEKYIIQRLNENGKLTADYNYTGLLFGTVDGIRTSLQEIIRELENIYDDIRFQINRELKKIRGDAVVVDRAYLPKGSNTTKVLHDLTENGLITYDSSAEGNRSGMDAESNRIGINSLNMGQSQTLIVLLNQAIDIERVMDKITGMNEGRQGLQKATTTATTNINNIEASRSITYDMFYFMNKYMEDVLLKICEKTKLNQVHYGKDSRQFVYDYKDKAYFISTRDLMLDNYGVSLTDGKKERDVLNKLEALFPQEINAGLLRTKDVAQFYQASSFAEAIKVLDNAHEELQKVRQEESRVAQESNQANIEMQERKAVDEREDRQEHEKELEVMRQEGAKEQIVLKESLSAKAKLGEAQIKANQANE